MCLLGAADRGPGAAGTRRRRQSPQDVAPIDLTGYWVSVITEDWKFRMVTPKKGVYETLPLNAEGRKVGDTWDPARDEAAGEQCRAYGAGNIMRVPGGCTSPGPTPTRCRSTPTPARQTRLLRFDPTAAPPPMPTWQGHSRGGVAVRPGGRGVQNRGGNLKVVTTQPACRLRAQERRALQRQDAW